MWRSKLGNDFPKEEIDRDEKKNKAELDRLRRLPENRHCADCGANDTVWASVNLGVFLCMTCGAHHLGLGTHISLPKGCTGTYLWGPDEIERLASLGNAQAARIYGGDAQRPPPMAPYWQWRQYIVDKYQHKKFAPKQHVVPKESAPPTRPTAPVSVPNSPIHHAPTLVSATCPKGVLRTPMSPLRSSPRTNPDREHFDNGDFSSAGSPTTTSVLRPAHHVSPVFPKSHPLVAPKLAIRLKAPADARMAFDNDDDLLVVPSTTKLPRKNKRPTTKTTTPLSPTFPKPTIVFKPQEATAPSDTDFFENFGV